MKRLFYVAMTLALFLAVGCSKDDFSPEDSGVCNLNELESGNNFVLGKKLKNPYSLDNMRLAYSQVSSLAKSAVGEIKATHLYVRFVPEDSVQFAEIQKDTSIFYYSFPLDYEIVEGGDCYQEVCFCLQGNSLLLL